MNSVVYYPHLVPNLNWLKVASLCWDKVHVLHPKDSMQFPEDIRIADARLGSILRPVNTYEIGKDPEILHSFLNWIDDRAEHINKNQLLASQEDYELYKMFEGKLPPEIIQKLQDKKLIINESSETEGLNHPYFRIGGEANGYFDKGLIEKKRNKGEGTLAFLRRMKEEGTEVYQTYGSNLCIPSEVALHFLSLCASKAARLNNADIYGDNIEYFKTTTLNPSNVLVGQITQSVVEAYLPENIDNISMDSLFEIREELSEKRALFQSEIQSITKKFLELSSEDELNILKKRVISIAKERIDNTEKTFRNNRIQLVLKSIGISLTPPALVSYISSALTIGNFAPVGIGLSLALFTGNSIIDYKKAQSEYNNNAWSYINDIKNKF